MAAKPSFSTSRIITMLSSSKFRRIKDREERKAEKERNLLSLKQSTLQAFQPRARTQLLKCSNCNKGHENYNINFEWLLEPIDVLKENRKGFLGRYALVRKLLSFLLRALVVEPAQIKIIKHLQEHKMNVPIAFVMMKSNQMEFERILIKFIFDTFDLNAPKIILNENEIREALNTGKSIIIYADSQIQVVFDILKERNIFWIPVSIGYEIHDSNPFSFTPYGILQKAVTGCGLVKVAFHDPYTSDDFFERRNPSGKFIQDHLYHEIIFKAPVMAPNLIAFLLLTYHKKGGNIEEMSVKVDTIRKDMCTIDFAFEGKAIDVVEHSLEILKAHIIIDNAGIITPKEDKIEELKDYARVLLYHHVLKSAILSCAALLKSIDPFIDFNKMMNYAADLFDELSEKIPFKVCASVEDQLNEAFDSLSISDLLKRPTITLTEKERRALKIAKYFEDDDDDGYGNDYEYCCDDDESDTEEEELDSNNQVIINIDEQEEIEVLKGIVLLFQGNI